MTELAIERIRRSFPDANRIVARAPVLHVGWELDNEVCAVEMKDGSRILVTTNLNELCQMDSEELQEFVRSYESAIEQSRAVMAALDR